MPTFVTGTRLTADLQLAMPNGAPLANGVYLYRVTVRGHDGTVKTMGIRKMFVLR